MSIFEKYSGEKKGYNLHTNQTTPTQMFKNEIILFDEYQSCQTMFYYKPGANRLKKNNEKID